MNIFTRLFAKQNLLHLYLTVYYVRRFCWTNKRRRNPFSDTLFITSFITSYLYKLRFFNNDERINSKKDTPELLISISIKNNYK